MANKVNTIGITDLDMSVIAKQKFRIDGDDDRILELNTSDLSVVTRLSEAYPKLNALQSKVTSLRTDIINVDESDDNSIELLTQLGNGLKEVDSEMRALIDYIFDSNVCEVVSPFGSMYDPIGGSLRYEHIIEKLVALYSDTINAEATKTRKNMNKHTAKYVGNK